MSFYRKYRPQVIDQIDNASVRSQLLSLLSRDRKELPHAYFFTGPKGTGKTTAARVIAKLFNCTKITKAGPCGQCEQCKNISNGTSMDVIEMDAASNRGIDEIRQLRERIGLTPSSSEYTIYIIDEVHMLTTEAFNALLKTLEEPPVHAIFVLATTDAHKVPATIKSRCVEINFHRASIAELQSALQRVTKGEKIEVDDEAIALIAAAADGSFRDAVKIMEQASLTKGRVTESTVSAIIPSSSYEKLGNFLTPLFAKKTQESLEYISELQKKGFDLRAFLMFVLQALESDLVNTVKETSDTKYASMEDLNKAIAVFLRAYEEIRYSPVPQLPIELAIIEFCEIKRAPEPPPRDFPIQKVAPAAREEAVSAPQPLGLLTLEKLIEHWPDFIAAMKPHNHSVAGVLRSSRPKAVDGGIVTIEAFYKFHQEKLADIGTKQVLSEMLKKLFGEKVKVEIVLGKK